MQPKFRRLYAPKIRTVLAAVFIIVAIIGLTKSIMWAKFMMDATGLTPATLVHLLINTGAKLKQTDGRTNIMILGIGGGNHEGADLTDTMIVFSLDAANKKMALISIPRDIWSDTLKDKINSAYHYGEEKKKGGGMVLSEVVVEDVVGIPIHYELLIDFSGFEQIINLVGGVEVTVPKAFTDPDFPIPGKENDPCDGDRQYRCRYETLTFDAGAQRMDGARALKYVRSRHAEGGEGSDFARSSRQQDVSVALKQKLLTPGVYLSPSGVSELLRAFDRATDTDLRIGELATFGKIISKIPEERITRISFEDELMTPPTWMYGRYVLVPKDDYPTLHEFIKRKLQ